MGEITLIRHGQASFGADDYDKLSALGHEQARWLGEYVAAQGWRFDSVYRGELRRHRETAEGIVAALDVPPVKVDGRFDEMHYDPLQEAYLRETGSDAPQSRPEFLHMFPRLFDRWGAGALITDAEPFADFDARVNAALDAAVTPDQRVLIVTSGGVISMIMRRVLNLDLATTADMLLNIHNASVHRLTLEEGRLRLSLFNACPHLDHESRAHARTYI